MIVIGAYPAPLLERMEPSVRAVLERIEQTDPDLGLAELGVRADVRGFVALAGPTGSLWAGDPSGSSGSPLVGDSPGIPLDRPAPEGMPFQWTWTRIPDPVAASFEVSDTDEQD